MGASMGLQSRVSSDRFSYLHSSLLYICSELDVSLITSRSIDTFGLDPASWIRVRDGAITCEDFDGALVANLLAKFRMLEIERYTGIGYPCIHLRLYSTIMRAHGLDETQMVILFPMSLSGATQRWFASLDALYGIEKGIARGLWSESSPTSSKGKKPLG
ncbi:hypothetical protein CK203_029704 [Vitis vinifera]|uniref:Retrotransposon gag domain-containing protein n=1 Tax=Vitis vinifera TaxID=29760 RepID=A0A438IIK9_VITVI|nr:hypothetical protein CK203_029704 [Vitis vinifera]